MDLNILCVSISYQFLNLAVFSLWCFDISLVYQFLTPILWNPIFQSSGFFQRTSSDKDVTQP